MKALNVAVFVFILIVVVSLSYELYLTKTEKSINSGITRLQSFVELEDIENIDMELCRIEETWISVEKIMLSLNDHKDVVCIRESLAFMKTFAYYEDYQELNRSMNEFKIHFNTLIHSNRPYLENIL